MVSNAEFSNISFPVLNMHIFGYYQGYLHQRSINLTVYQNEQICLKTYLVGLWRTAFAYMLTYSNYICKYHSRCFLEETRIV